MTKWLWPLVWVEVLASLTLSVAAIALRTVGSDMALPAALCATTTGAFACVMLYAQIKHP